MRQFYNMEVLITVKVRRIFSIFDLVLMPGLSVTYCALQFYGFILSWLMLEMFQHRANWSLSFVLFLACLFISYIVLSWVAVLCLYHSSVLQISFFHFNFYVLFCLFNLCLHFLNHNALNPYNGQQHRCLLGLSLPVGIQHTFVHSLCLCRMHGAQDRKSVV